MDHKWVENPTAFGAWCENCEQRSGAVRSRYVLDGPDADGAELDGGDRWVSRDVPNQRSQGEGDDVLRR